MIPVLEPTAMIPVFDKAILWRYLDVHCSNDVNFRVLDHIHRFHPRKIVVTVK